VTVIRKKSIKNERNHRNAKDNQDYRDKNYPITYPEIKVACILDEFSYECFKYECKLIDFGPNDWEETLSIEKPHLLLVESVWQGNGDRWRYIYNLNNKYGKALEKLVSWCKNNSIPTVFWNKEDPKHFERFINVAQLFDYVFTTDYNSIEKYKEILKHERIYVLPFAAQPRIHNPIMNDIERIGKVAFAGTWYGDHQIRKKNADIILKPALNYDLHIYDRNSDKNLSAYKYPIEYRKNIKSRVSYKKVVKLYKQYDVFLNINSVNNSPTMFSRRVFELLACGKSVISSYSLGIETMFPNIVYLSNSPEETIIHLENLLNNKDLRDRSSLLGLREVLNKHTYRHRIEDIFDKINLKYQKYTEPKVTVITCTKRHNSRENILNNFLNQKYENKELIIILNNNNMDENEWRKGLENYNNIRVYSIDETKNLGYCLNFGIEKSNGDLIAKFDDDDYYADNYLLDQVNAFKYTDADVVGKCTYYIYFEGLNILAVKKNNMENKYVKHVGGCSLVFKKELFKEIKFSTSCDSGCDTLFLNECNSKGKKIFSTDRFNLLVYRRSSPNDHTWKITQEKLLNKCEIVQYTDNPINYVKV